MIIIIYNKILFLQKILTIKEGIETKERTIEQLRNFFNNVNDSSEINELEREYLISAVERKIRIEFPENVEESNQLTPEEQPKLIESNYNRNSKAIINGEAFHKKSQKNQKTNQGGTYRRELAKKYKKPKTRGDKNSNKKRNKG